MKLAISTTKFNIFLINKGIYSWFLGLLIPVLYLSLIINFKQIIAFSKKKNFFTTFFYLLLVIQIISIFLSPLNEYFSFQRFLAITHNVFAYMFLFFGYYIAQMHQENAFPPIIFKRLFFVVAIISILVVIISFILKVNVSYPGFLYFVTGIKNDLTSVNFTHSGFILNYTIPRSRVFGTFPNTTAFILIVLYCLYVITSKKYTLWAGIVLILACLSTGARAATVVAFLLSVLHFINTRKKLIIVMMTMPLFIYFALMGLNEIKKLRVDSNDTRSELYHESILLTNKLNPIFGIGSKPLIENVAGGELPVGSHSTYIGYYVKNGIVGFSLVLFVLITVVVLSILNIIVIIYGGREGFNKNKLFCIVSFPLVLTVLAFDDLDAYEFMPFLLGIYIYFFEKSLLIKFKFRPSHLNSSNADLK